MIKVGGYVRATIGVVLLVAPGILGPAWIGADARPKGVRALVRALGIREVLIGAGAIIAANEGIQLRRWVEFAMVADATDAVATLMAARHIPASRAALVVTTAAGSATVQAWALSQLPEEVPSTR